MDYGVPVLPLGFLGACVRGEGEAFYRSLDEPGRSRLERDAAEHGLQAWLYRYLYDVLPEERRAEYRRVYQYRQAQAVRGEHELRSVFDELCGHGLRFAPVKAADLAYRVYPDPALRHGVDWDVWFHPDDCEKALDALAETGWRAPLRYTDSRDAVYKTSLHHYSPHKRDGYTLEPHDTLANFGDADPHDMWEYTLEVPDGRGRRVLSPELNLMMLARHAASNSYYHANLPKLLADAGMVMKHDPVDFGKLRALADRWRLPYPGDLLAAFPEFFTSDTIASFGADPEATARFRAIFQARGELGEPDTTKLTWNRSRERGDTGDFLASRIFSRTPLLIRNIYHLPKHGAWGRVCLGYVKYFWSRSIRVFASLLGGDRRLKAYCRLVESVESGPSRSH